MTVVTVLLVALAQNPHPGMGASVMGFDQDKTTHHFYLFEDGGAIDVSVKKSTDAVNRDAIRSHLPHIAMMFGQGDFNAPVLVHDTKNVPGVQELARLKDKIKYTYLQTDAGGRVNIVTLAAVHKFLAYQIAEHKTGDPTTVAKRK